MVLIMDTFGDFPMILINEQGEALDFETEEEAELYAEENLQKGFYEIVGQKKVQLQPLNLDIMKKEIDIGIDFLNEMPLYVPRSMKEDFNSAFAHLQDLKVRIENLEVI